LGLWRSTETQVFKVMRELIISTDVFVGMLPSLIESGVTFNAKENDSGGIRVIFTGGY
jgi:hypothetical protein